MQIQIISVGAQSSHPVAALVDMYEKRLQHTAKIQWCYIPAARTHDVVAAKRDEAQRIMAAVRPRDYVVLLDERGDLLNNKQLAQRIDTWGAAQGRLTCVIGGAFGVDQAVFDRAQAVWSLSPLVFPHEIMRVLLIEQLYRTMAIRTGHPYHHQ